MILEASDLKRILPHGPPIFMLDRLIDLYPRQRGTGLRTLSADDPCFAGHFPGHPIFPGVFFIEGLAQTAAAVFLVDQTPVVAGASFGVLAKVNEMAFYHPIVPGDSIEFKIEVERTIGPFSIVRGEVFVKGRRCGAGKLTLKMGAPP